MCYLKLLLIARRCQVELRPVTLRLHAPTNSNTELAPPTLVCVTSLDLSLAQTAKRLSHLVILSLP